MHIYKKRGDICPLRIRYYDYDPTTEQTTALFTMLHCILVPGVVLVVVVVMLVKGLAMSAFIGVAQSSLIPKILLL